jgi:sugar lactone lactonase YvrE
VTAPFIRQLAAVLLFGVCGAVAAAPFASTVLATHPHGSYLENLTVDRRGAVLYTDYFAKTVHVWRGGRSRVFARTPVHPVNLVEIAAGYLVLGHGGAFTDGPAALKDTNQLLFLSHDGLVLRSLVLPGVVFGNGMVLSGKQALLLTDSTEGLVWKVDLQSGHVEQWFRDPLLAPQPGSAKPAANGLRRTTGALLLTNSGARKVYRLPVDADDRPAGPLELLRETVGADDMAVAADGTVYVATHVDTVVRIRGDGGVEPVVVRDVEGCTSVALSRDGKQLFVLGTGGLFEGLKKPATLVRARVVD